MRVINCHAHFHGPDEVEEKRALWDSMGYEKICMSFQNDEVLKLAQRYPDYIIPFYHVNLDEEGPDAVDAAKERGFHGLKLIGPQRPYSHESYFPVYERAEALGMPALIHTGFLAFHAGRGVRQENLHPTYLITIGTYFPKARRPRFMRWKASRTWWTSRKVEDAGPSSANSSLSRRLVSRTRRPRKRVSLAKSGRSFDGCSADHGHTRQRRVSKRTGGGARSTRRQHRMRARSILVTKPAWGV